MYVNIQHFFSKFFRGIMKNGGIDKRIVKTKNAIRTAFNELVQTKDMADISISELTEKAGVTRSTFYMYYDSIGAVRNDIEDMILSHIDKIMTEANLVQSMLNPYPLLFAITNEINKYDEYNRYILSSNNSGELLEKLKKMITDAFVNTMQKNNQIQVNVAKAKYVAAFCTAGILEAFKLWFNHQSSLTLEELCAHISQMVAKGLAMANDFIKE